MPDRTAKSRCQISTSTLVSIHGVVLATAVAIALVLVPTIARAAEPVYVQVGSFGAPGSGEGALAWPTHLAVDSATGDILVTDFSRSRVDVYRPTPSGAEYLFAFGEGILAEPLGIAIDQADGDAYVSDPGKEALFKFDPDDRAAPTAYAIDSGFTSPAQGTEPGQIGSFGEFRGIFGAPTGGLAVDPADGDLLLADPGRGLVSRFDSEGAFIDSFDGSGSGQALAAPSDIAVDAAGTVLVADQASEGLRALEFTEAGGYLATLGPVAAGASWFSGVVALDAAGSAFVGSKTANADPARIARFDAGGSLVQEIEGEGMGGFPVGLAASGGAAPRLYVDATSSTFGTYAVQVFEAVEPPLATIEPVSPGEVGATQASFAGAVDPDGYQVGECAFQYVTEAEYEASGFTGAGAVACEPPPGSGEAPEPVAASATGLEPNTAYRVRLRATGRMGAAAISAVEAFATQPQPPDVATGAAWSLSDTTATLTGTVDPRNSEVIDCHIEYGPSEAYGSSLPCRQGRFAGDAAVAVDVEVGDLAPAEEYHYRLVATGGVGGTRDGVDATFRTPTAAESELPPRGYELVSAPDTNGVDPLPLAASHDGEDYVYATFIPAPGSGSGVKSLFRALRAPDGSWSQSYVGTPAPPSGEGVTGSGGPLFSSDDLATMALGTSQGIDAEDRNRAGDVYLREEGGSWTWASRDPLIQGPQTEGGAVAGPVWISPDGSRVLFESSRHLLPADRSGEGHRSLYEWDQGALSLIGYLPGESLGSEAGSELGSVTDELRGTSYGAVSQDGSRVVFQSGTGGFFGFPELYLRLDGERTVQVSRSAPGLEPALDSPLHVSFAGADAEDRVIFFTSTSALTADSGAGGSEGEADLYAYDVAGGELHDLTPHGEGGGVERVYAVSEDGGRVYFTSTRELVQGEGVPGEANLYLAEVDGEGRLSRPLGFVATIDPAEDANQEGADRPQAWRELASDPDGSVLAFRDRLAPVPDRQTGGHPQVYVYEARSGSLYCASCPGDGSVPDAGADLLPALPAGGSPEPSVDAVLNLVANTAAEHIVDVTTGGAVLFQTANALVPRDTNGQIDVYEWHGGRVGLVSAGGEPHDSIYGGASLDGSSVFFSSADGLVAGAQDGVRHIYAAVVGGGAPTTPTVPPQCEAGDCRSQPPTSPPQPGLGTASFSGPGNERPRHPCRRRAGGRRHCAHRRARHRRRKGHRHRDRHAQKGGAR